MCFKIKNQKIGVEYESGQPIVYIKYNGIDYLVKISNALIEDKYGINSDKDSSAKKIVERNRNLICEKLNKGEKTIFISVDLD